MATLKAVVRNQRSDGFYPVYIRIGHRTRMGYIRTNKVVSPKQVTKGGVIKDSVVVEYCSHLISRYNEMLNKKNIDALSVAEVIEYLTSEDNLESFSEYAQLHIRRMEQRGQHRNAKNYYYCPLNFKDSKNVWLER